LSKITKPYIGQNNKSQKVTNGINGVAIFDVDKEGILSDAPIQILPESQPCRLENVSIEKDLCAITDATNNTVRLYNFDGNCFPDTPVQIIKDRLSFPHDACLSPNGAMLVVTNYGINIIDKQPQWVDFIHPRSDKLTFYELQD